MSKEITVNSTLGDYFNHLERNLMMVVEDTAKSLNCSKEDLLEETLTLSEHFSTKGGLHIRVSIQNKPFGDDDVK